MMFGSSLAFPLSVILSSPILTCPQAEHQDLDSNSNVCNHIRNQEPFSWSGLDIAELERLTSRFNTSLSSLYTHITIAGRVSQGTKYGMIFLSNFQAS